MNDDIYEHYKRIPLKERTTGAFSERSIDAHHAIMKAHFFKKIKHKLFTSAINYAISYALVILVIFAFCNHNGYPFNEASSIIRFLFVCWCFTFIAVTVLRVADYPTRKKAVDDLDLISAIEEDINNPDFVA